MQDILIILACISLGMAAGFWRRADAGLMRLADRLSLYAVYALLFVLGGRLGGDEVLLRTLPVLGLRALCIAFFCIAGSVACLAFVGRFFPFSSGKARNEAKALPSPVWGSVRILGWFAGGILLALAGATPDWLRDGVLASRLLYLLVFSVGIGLGADLRAFRILRVLHVKVLSVPLLIVLGSGLGAVAASWVLPGMSVKDSLSVGMGLGYYSLSSILIENAGNSALASTALLSNILREVAAILAAPLLARHCGRLSTVGAAGATAMDTTLPIIARFSGEHVAVVAVFSGMTLTLLVPFLVAAVLQWP